jgi:hypothetical protein
MPAESRRVESSLIEEGMLIRGWKMDDERWIKE